MIKFEKRGQAAAAAVLLAIIAGLMIMFVILVSPDERAAILDGNGEASVEDSDSSVMSEILLEEYPGKVEYLSLDEVEHSLASVRIYTETNSVEFKTKNSIYADNGLFSGDVGEMSFTISDLENTDDVLLNFNIDDCSEGNLKIIVNEEELYNQPMVSGESPIVEIPDYLISEDNLITFEVSSPGAAFWRTNYVSLLNLKVVGDVADFSHQEASNTFLISETEYNNVELLELQFQPECDYDEVDNLIITVNDYDVYSGVPECGLSSVPIEFSPELIYEGENYINFFVEDGEYELYHLKVISELEEIKYVTYYFDLSYEEAEAIEDDDNYVEVTLEFTDDTSTKTGYLNINGDKEHFDTREISYTMDISEEVVQGNNAIQIVPSTTLEVREFVVELN